MRFGLTRKSNFLNERRVLKVCYRKIADIGSIPPDIKTKGIHVHLRGF